MVWPVLIALLAVVAIVLVYPLWWRSAQPLPVGLEDSETDQALADEQRRLLLSLRRLHYDYAEGRMTAADYRALEAEYQLALALAMERQAVPQALSPAEPEQAAAPRKVFYRVGSLGVVLLLAVPAVTIFTPPSALMQTEKSAWKPYCTSWRKNSSSSPTMWRAGRWQRAPMRRWTNGPRRAMPGRRC